MKFEVICMSKDCSVPTKIVDTYEEAEDYIKKFICDDCLKDLEKGYCEFEYYDIEEHKTIKEAIKIKYPSDTLCGAEFMIQEIK